MNEPEIKFDSTGGSGIEELRSEVQSLRAALSLSLLFLFIFSFCVNLFLVWQNSMLSRQVAQNEAVVKNFEDSGAGQIIGFWTKLKDYSRAHPDFKPVIDKYSPFINVHTNAPAAKPK